MLTQTGAFHSPGTRSGRPRAACRPLTTLDPAGPLQSARQLQQPSPQLRCVECFIKSSTCCSSSSSAGVSQADSEVSAPIATSRWQHDSTHQHIHSNFVHVAVPLAQQRGWQPIHHKHQQEQQQQHLQPRSSQEHTGAAALAAHHAAAHARPAASEAAGSAAEAADVASWRILQLHDPQDLLSARIVSCGTVEQLLTTAQQVVQHGNKLQAARLTVLAAALVQQQQQPHNLDAILQCSAHAAGQWSASNSTTAAAQQPEAAELEAELLNKVVLALTQGTAAHSVSALRALSSRYLAETLYALHQLAQHLLPGQQQQELQLQELIAAQAAQMPQQHILSAIHACGNVQQLSAVVGWLHSHMTQTHVKAAFVQLARVVQSSSSSYRSGSSSSSSSVGSSVGPSAAADAVKAQQLLQLLLRLLQGQQQPPQPHAAASILWSIGQLQPLLSDSQQLEMRQLAQHLLEAALSGLHRLNHRVCAMMLHGAAKLQLQLPGDAAAVGKQIMQHTEQQLEHSDPQALSNLLWSFAQLQVQPSSSWMLAFYNRSLRSLHAQHQQHQRGKLSTSSSKDNSSKQEPNQAFGHAQRREQHWQGQPSATSSRDNGKHAQQQWQPQHHSHGAAQQQRGQQQRDEAPSFNPQELAAILSSLAHLELQSPVDWLLAAACSCHLQLQRFGHQELALMLWAFAKLQQQLGFPVPAELLDQAGRRIQQLLAGSSSSSSDGVQQVNSSSRLAPNSLSLLLYAVVKLQLQPQGLLLQQLWQHLQHSSNGPWPQTLWQLPWGSGLPGAQHYMAGAAGSAIQEPSSGHLGAARDREAMLHLADPAAAAAAVAQQYGADFDCWIGQVYRQSVDQLEQYNAHDLALLAWGLARKQHEQQNQGQGQQLQPPSADWIYCYMAAASKQLQRGRFTAQGLTMMLWGLAVLVARSYSSGACSSDSSNGASSGKQCQAVIAAFQATVEQQSLEKLEQFSVFELSSILWGAGALRKYLGSSALVPTSEWVDLIACHCLDGIEQLSNCQVLAALQGLVWLQHPRGLSHLQQILSDRRKGQLLSLQPHEMLLVLHACVYYKHIPEQSVLHRLLAAVQQQAGVLQQQKAPAAASFAAQVPYVLGKLQQQHVKQQKQQHCSSCSSARAGHAEQQQGTAAKHIALAPACIVWDLVECVSSRLASCPAAEVSRMLWGLSQLASPGLTQQQQQLGTALRNHGSDSSSLGDPPPIAAGAGCSSSVREVDQQAHAAFAEHAAGQQLLQAAYSYTLQNLDEFHPNELAMVLHSVHKLGVMRPPAQWLRAVVKHLTPKLCQLHGQGLAALIVSLSMFNWSPPPSWLCAFVDAAVAVDASGGLKTEWQQACIQHGLSALDPMVGEAWLHRRRIRARVSRQPPSIKSRGSSCRVLVGVEYGAAA